MEKAQPNNQNDDLIFENEIKISKLKSKGTLGMVDLFLSELRSMYDVKKSAFKALPKIIKHACSFELIEAVTRYFEETKTQIIRLEDVFAVLEENPVASKCEMMEYLLRESETMIDAASFGTVRDAAIILSFYKIIQYETASYTMLSSFAEIIEEPTIIDLLAESINAEKIAGLRLEKIMAGLRLSPEGN